MERDQLVLAAMAAGGENAAFSPAQIQKLFFLIDREAARATGGPHFAFRPYDYGPFDHAVYTTVASLAASGLASIRQSNHYRVYSLTPMGFQAGARALERLAPDVRTYIRDLATWILQLNFQQLVTEIYRYYPDMKVNSVFSG